MSLMDLHLICRNYLRVQEMDTLCSDAADGDCNHCNKAMQQQH